MRKYHLGEFEEIVIQTIGIRYHEAYGVAIKNEAILSDHSAWKKSNGVFEEHQE
ncbi:hypothetical protein WBG78_20630 [Chryseolinea sp. T2]|uniref:hypothetical protein n=1 Tax=Chryseolinea sp. T2 TaxID=3129255 RepID=UPI00307750B9